jgi:hypothetical protein
MLGYCDVILAGIEYSRDKALAADSKVSICLLHLSRIGHEGSGRTVLGLVVRTALRGTQRTIIAKPGSYKPTVC